MSDQTNSRLGIAPGSGHFVFDHPGDGSHPPLPVHYFCPSDPGGETEVIFVMHGLNRDAERYRDRWLDHATQEEFVLLVPEFDRELYPSAEDYNLGGMVDCERDTEFNEEEDWAFHQIEGIFELVRDQLRLTTEGYGIYGHSAGAQFVHRLVLFHLEVNLRVAVAANSGWYTLPCQETEFPYGLAETPITESRLARALRRKLVVLLGENDNDPEHDNLRVTPEALEQGQHRLERGQTFYEIALTAATELETSCDWKLETIPNAAHRDRDMSVPALSHLLG